MIEENSGVYFKGENSSLSSYSSGTYDFNYPKSVSKVGREYYELSNPQNIRLSYWFINNSLPQGYLFNNSKDDLNGMKIREKSADGFNLSYDNPNSTYFWEFYNTDGLHVQGYNSPDFPPKIDSFMRIAFVMNLENITMPQPTDYTTTIVVVASVGGIACAVVIPILVYKKRCRS